MFIRIILFILTFGISAIVIDGWKEYKRIVLREREIQDA